MDRVIIFLIIGLFLSSSFVVISTSNEVPILKISSIGNGPMDSPWPMKCYDQYHTSQSPYNTADNNGVVLWEYETRGWLYTGISIDENNVLYFCNGDGYVHAVYPNGSLKWKFDAGDDIRSTPALAADGTIYFTCLDEHLFALKSDGTLKWKFDSEGPIICSPVIDENGIVYFGNHGIHAIYSNGTEYWNYPVGNTYCDPAIGYDGSVYIGSTNTYFYAFYPNGTLQWRFKTGDEIHSHPSIGLDGTIYIGSNDGYLYALHPNGTLYWKYKINGNLYASAAIGADGTIYCPDHDLYAFYPDGTVKWQFDFGENIGVGHSSPAISKEGIIYIGAYEQGRNSGYIFAINPDGAERWQRKITTYFTRSSPTIGRDGTVYIGSTWHEYINNNFYGIMYAFGEGNNPPNPPMLTGPNTGKIRTEYTYTVSTIDLDDEHVSYYIDWGDGTNTGWTTLYPSGSEKSFTHEWNSKGTYTIKAKAKDERGMESDWTSLEVSMPKTKGIFFFNSFEKIKQMFFYLQYKQ